MLGGVVTKPSRTAYFNQTADAMGFGITWLIINGFANRSRTGSGTYY